MQGKTVTEATPAVAPAPMEGHGTYNRSSRVQAAGASPAIALLEQAAREAALPPAPEPVMIPLASMLLVKD